MVLLLFPDRCLSKHFSVFAVDNLIDAMQNAQVAGSFDLRCDIFVKYDISNLQIKEINRRTHRLKLILPAQTWTIEKRVRKYAFSKLFSRLIHICALNNYLKGQTSCEIYQCLFICDMSVYRTQKAL